MDSRKMAEAIRESALLAHDPVNSPDHYTSGKIECIEIIDTIAAGYEGDAAFYVGTAIKYLYRAPYKGSAVQDLKKARWYLDRLIDKLDDDAA